LGAAYRIATSANVPPAESTMSDKNRFTPVLIPSLLARLLWTQLAVGSVVQQTGELSGIGIIADEVANELILPPQHG
jgi:hypothetical protein